MKSFNNKFVIVIFVFLKILINYKVTTEKLNPIKFSGLYWDYKTGSNRGPGNNTFRYENIYVDKEDRLHLSIRQEKEGLWSCSEVYTQKQGFGYGLYSFSLFSDITKFDASTVVGLYIYDLNKEQFNREIDIEFAKWNRSSDPTNAQFVVQPYNLRTNIVRFKQPSTNISIHEFLWTKDNVKFRSYDLSDNISVWSFNKPGQHKKVFTPGNETVRINFWLWASIPPISLKNHHLIISDFSFTPIEELDDIYFE